MSTISPVVADAFRLLRDDLYGQLDDIESLALRFEEWSSQDIELARELIPSLVIVIRGLLLEHQVRPGGECRVCTSAWPCPVVTAIHGLLKDPEGQFGQVVRRASQP
ncbi:MAG: hypothetical protein ABR608_15860 [Pseudonocardiaceae bacterium]